MDHWTISHSVMVILAAFAATSNGQLLIEESAGHHLDIDTPLDEMGCYYCVNVSSNEICNRYAIETSCPTDLPVCYTQHIMDAHGQTLSVTKQCASERTCSSQIGCRQDKSTNQTVCVNCCDLTYCNEEVAFNETTAVFQRSSDQTEAAFSSAHRSKRWTAWPLVLAGLLSSLTR